MTTLTREQIRQVACPKCNSAPGAQCDHGDGYGTGRKYRLGISHVERMHRAQADLIDRSGRTRGNFLVRGTPEKALRAASKPNHYAKEAAARETPLCPDCGQRAQERETEHGIRCTCHKCGLWSWDRHPLVDAQTHAARRAAHSAFDPLWREAQSRGYVGFSRSVAYWWLSELLGIDPKDCHMKMMDLATAQRVPAACAEIDRKAREVPF